MKKFDDTIKVTGTDEWGCQLPGKRTLKVHNPESCEGETCAVHNPSNHPLRDAPMNWRTDRRLMERICEHGVGHPDKDDLAFGERQDPGSISWRGIHGCCAESCCTRKDDDE